MKLFFKIINCIVISLLLFSSCRDESDQVKPGSEVAVYIRMKIPPTNSFRSRAVEENVINNINILVFEDTDRTGYGYAYTVAGYSLSSGVGDTYDFRARIVASDNPLKLYFLANISNMPSFTSGASEEEIRRELVRSFPTTGFVDYLPMSGINEFTSGITNTTNNEINVTMVRSVARIDVQNTSADFTLTSVYAYRASNLYQIIPDIIINDTVTEASIPAGTTRSVNVGRIDVNGELFEGQLYLPESPVVATEDQLTATTIVIGGIYEGDTQETFYRLDFIPDDNPDVFGQILRNHRYVFTITEVLASGWNDPDEAANNNSSDITAEIKEWNENNLYMSFDEANYFGVSSRTIVVGHAEGASSSFEVDTNVDDYTIYWLDDEGNVDDSEFITLGESFQNDLFSVAISDDGTRITATALNNLDPAVDSVSSRLRVEANRLRINLRIVQRRPVFTQQSLRIYNSVQEFTLGNNTLGDGVFPPNDRTRAMVNILNSRNNFGPDGTVPINGISIAGQDRVDFPANLPELFDVIYLTYNRNPNVTTTGYITNWLVTSERRVLIVQYDNGVSNANLLSALGITGRIQSENINPFTVYDDAPSEIMNGLFGPVPYSLQIRCYDTIHGEIPETVARANGITPILRGGSGEMVLGIDFNRRVVYSGDADIYSGLVSANPGLYLSTNLVSSNGVITNDADRFIANLWAWIAEIVLGEREEE